MTRHLRTLVLAAAATAFGLAGSPAGAQTRAQVGTLTCNLAPSVGLIVGSQQRMSCTFVPSGPGPREGYGGTITRAGLDIGFTSGGRMVWGVFSRVAGLSPGALAGTYVGASGDIALGLGVGANALVGGSNRSVALQPLSVEAQAGVNLALGVAGLRLVKVR